MGLGGISISELLIVLVIVVLIFGTKRLKSVGSDLGGAIKGFRSSMGGGDNDKKIPEEPKPLANPQPDAEFPEQKQKSRQA